MRQPTARANASFSSFPARDWPVYQVCGVTLASDFPFANRLCPGRRAPDLTFTLARSSPAGDELEKAVLLHSEPDAKDFGIVNYLYRIGDGYVMRFAGIADFYLWRDRIVCELVDPDYYYTVEIYFLGAVLAFWLEIRGTVPLHASAVVMEDRAAAFLSMNGGGKSSLAAALMQRGCALLTDDMLPVESSGDSFRVHAAYPQMRLWPEEARHFVGHYEDLEAVNPYYAKRRVAVGTHGIGTFCADSKELACIYLPERRDPADSGGGIEIKSVSRRDAVIEMIWRAFAPRNAQAAGFHRRRLEAFSAMARRIPMRRLIYPNGLHHLSRVADAVAEDFSLIRVDAEAKRARDV